ncbi:hypothetical protein, partial [Desulfobulbus alkaliphilus]|uniref:hypothetical protein n=1 Tax=Desulfobulbus alkaliphilus TaxID=869814 RepID=UPI0019652159
MYNLVTVKCTPNKTQAVTDSGESNSSFSLVHPKKPDGVRSMSLTIRRFLLVCGLGALLVAWWFPAPQLYRGEPVDWASLYEENFTPPEVLWPALAWGATPKLLQSFQDSYAAQSVPVPLSVFISETVMNRILVAKEPSWGSFFKGLEQGMDLGMKVPHYARPSDEPHAQLASGRSENNLYGSIFVEWQNDSGIHHVKYDMLPSVEFPGEPIPGDLRYPLRQYWYLLILGGLGMGILALTGSAKEVDLISISTPSRLLGCSMIGAVVFVGMVIWPEVTQTFDSNVSYISIMLGAVFLVLSVIGIIYNKCRVGQLKEMINNENYVYHFTLNEAEWNSYVTWDRKKRNKKILTYYLCAISIGILFIIYKFLFSPDEKIIFLGSSTLLSL